MESIGSWAIPAVVLFIPLWGLIKGIKVYEVFIEGAKKGLAATLRITPYLIAMLVSIRVFNAAGGLDILTEALAPISKRLAIPQAVIPMFLIRPLSGSGALAMLGDILKTQGPDTLAGFMASVVQGSTETTLYVLTVYFGAVNVFRVRRSLTIGLWADLVGFVAAVCACSWFFKG
ncbi:MAG: spore maturation protein [Firmicutes bacterium]|nr:spore maturation protein [Bacillota bacterium]